MAKYKVSYKILCKQGEEIKAIAKLLDRYAEQIEQIRGRLGQDEMLSSVCGNLQKLSVQLGESRAIINMVGEVLSQSVEGYSALETRQIKKVEALKAHNRDFYKNPVVVASVGGAVAAPAAASAATINYTENNTYINTAPDTSGMTTGITDAVADTVQAPATAKESTLSGAGLAAGAGGVYAAGRLKKRQKEQKIPEDEKAGLLPEDDPEVQLALAIERVKRLQEEDLDIPPNA